MAYSPMLPVRCFPTAGNQIYFVHEKIEISGNPFLRESLLTPSLSPYYEIIFFVQGKRDVVVGDQHYFCAPGDILFFNPEEPRTGFNYTDEYYDWFHFYIYPDALAPFADYDSLMRCFLDRPYCRANQFSIPEPAHAELNQLFFSAEKAYSENELLCGTYLLQILLRLNAILPKNEYPHGKGSRPKLLQQILQEISEKPERVPSIADLTQKFGISRSGLWRLFHSHLNVSPQHYLQLRRLAYAKLLLQDGMSVTETSMRAGFGECSRFISYFRTSYGITPLQYQKQIHIR